LGGDEFVALLDGVNNNDKLEQIAKAVLDEMEAPIHLTGAQLNGTLVASAAPGSTLNGAPIFVRASIGLARGSADHTPEDLLRNADTAMYHAKATGRGRYQAFDSSMHQRALARLELENDLRHALDRNQFELYFQPQVELARGTLSGFEALLRWHHPERGLVMPGEFIPVAEENGLIIPLGQWVIRQACLKMAFWRSVFPDAGHLTISVNLSSKQFSDPALPAAVANILVETALPPSQLHLEITESILADDPEAARGILSHLKAMGIGLEIDDFGTGYSSLGQLHRLPFDTMKVDRGFVRAMDHEPDGRKIVQSITSLARSLGIVVVAEGIETEDHWLLLEALGCQYGQGFFFAHPLNSAAAQILIAHRLNEPWPWPANALSKSISDLLALGPALEDNAALIPELSDRVE
jgi:EAL domain-containing protein (putative c-di-GMP-specific phosphodiesterase class I)